MQYLKKSQQFLPVIYVAIALSLLALTSCEALAQDCDNDPFEQPDELLLGQVKTFRTERVEIPDWFLGNKKEGPRKPYYEATYNPSGYMTKETLYKEDGSVGYEHAYTYNTDGRLTEKSGSTEKTVFTYDQHGNRIERFNYGGPSISLMTKFVYGYDTNGMLATETIYSGKDNSLFNQTAYTYNDKELLVEKVERGTHDSMTKLTCTYDDKARLTSVTRKADFRGIVGKKNIEQYSYSDKGSFVEVSSSDPYGRFRTRLTYDLQGHKFEEAAYDKNGSLGMKRNYDQQGNVSKLTCATFLCESVMGEHVFTRDFDLMGNWIKETDNRLNKNGGLQASSIRYRIITYYSETASQLPKASSKKVTDGYNRALNLPFAPKP